MSTCQILMSNCQIYRTYVYVCTLQIFKKMGVGGNIY